MLNSSQFTIYQIYVSHYECFEIVVKTELKYIFFYQTVDELRSFRKITKRRSSGELRAHEKRVSNLEERLRDVHCQINLVPQERLIHSIESDAYIGKMREAVYICQSYGVSSKNTGEVISNIMKTFKWN